MKKIKQLMTVVVALIGTTALGETYSDAGSALPASGSGEYFLYNVGQQKFLTAGASWGTDACLDDHGIPLTVTYISEGKYTIGTLVGGGYIHLDGGRLNAANGTSVQWGIEKVENGEAYTLKYDDTNGYMVHLSAGSEGSVNTSATWTDGRERLQLNTATPDANGQWLFVTKEERLATLNLASASIENPIDVTFLLPAANFIKDDSRNSKWTGADIKGDNTYNIADKNCQQWSGGTTDMATYQALSGLPEGKYTISCQGYYYHDGFATTDDEERYASLYASTSTDEVSIQLPSVTSGGLEAAPNGATMTAQSDGKYYPNNNGNAAHFFQAGHYQTGMTGAITSTGELTIGVKTTSMIKGSWTVFDNVRLYYVGTAEALEISKTNLNETIEKAQGWAEIATYKGKVREALNSAIATAQSVADGNSTNSSDYDNALTALSTAIETFQQGYAADVINNATTGDVTAAVFNADFENTTDLAKAQWEGAGWWSNNEHWNNGFTTYAERTSSGTISQTIKNVPAGTYRVVAALRAKSGNTIQMKANDEAATLFTGAGNSCTGEQINSNGVQMPYSAYGGFATGTARGHQWRGVSITLSEAGDITISFVMSGSNWMSVDDVHLYDMSKSVCLNGISENATVETGKTLTCDVVVTNPNVIISSTEALLNTVGKQLNNNLVSGSIANLILYDGYEYTAPEGEYGATNATLYRSLPADMWCTLVVPFTPSTIEGMMTLTPTTFKDNAVTFDDTTPAADVPMLVKNTTDAAITAITGTRTSASTTALTSGIEAAKMNGTYTKISAIEKEANNYVVARAADATEDKLYLVNSDVSLGAFRAYLTLAATQQAIGIRYGEGTTEIDDLQFITDSSRSTIYDITGRRIDNPGTGIYIVNGRKVIIK